MRRDSRLSGVLHLLLHLAQRDEPSTSEELSRAMDTHPVVVRRILGGLRDRGFVDSEKGHGGGWRLARPLSEISLRDVYEALGSPALLAIGHRSETPGCAVEKAVNGALGAAFQEAEALLLSRFEEVSLEALHRDVGATISARRRAHQTEEPR